MNAQMRKGMPLCVLLAGFISLPLSAFAALSISGSPLFLSVNVAPNVVMTLDDSGSMESGYVPDAIGNSRTKLNGARFTAASYNGLYYNPSITYAVPQRSDGVSYSTTFTNAYLNGFDTSRGSIDLSASGYKPITSCKPGDTYSNCSKASGAGSVTSTTTTTYTYTNCTVFFDNQTGGNNDRIYVKGCGMPNSGTGQPQDADSSQITVTQAGSYSGTYAVSSNQSDNSWDVRINLSSSKQISKDSTLSGVNFTWTVTETTTSSSSAYYHLYYANKPGASKPSGCSDSVEDDKCYILILVGSANDITPGSAAQQKQNFANWYSFYRTRSLAVMSAATNAVTSLGANQVRFGWQTLNNGNCDSFGTSCQGYDNGKHENRLRTLDAFKTGSSTLTHRSDFYNWLQAYDVGGNTPLRTAMTNAGTYYAASGKDSPYAQEPYVTQGTELTCRKNFHIMFTDGYWNNDSLNIGNVDNTAATMPDSTSYTARSPFKDDTSDTLADIAFKYWKTDLRSDLDNNVAPYITDRSGTSADQYWNPQNDPATWQHMVNFTIGIGLSTALVDPVWGGGTYAGDYSLLASGTKSWPAVSSNSANNVYDLWHAAINSRGQFFSADNPAAVNAAFKSVFDSILAATPSAAALAANSTSIQTGTLLYQARFDSTDWHGQLIAYPVSSTGTPGTAQWDAAALMPASASRNIYTWNGSAGKAFTSCTSSLSAAQKLALDTNSSNGQDNLCTARLVWLRGDPSQEVRNGGAFRNRKNSVLGDIINSDPAFVQTEDYGYASATSTAFTEKSSYAAFVSGKSSRIPMVYVGANDGMLHAFRADVANTNSGKEQFAFVPAGVYGNLSRLTDPGYAHAYYVDGPPKAGDGYWSGTWHSVLVGGLGAGGKSIYALDVSDPAHFSETSVLWEYSDAVDLGNTFSQPQIGRLASGDWVAVFGNGYNSASDKAFLYVVRLQDGHLLQKIAASSVTANGLSTPLLVDANKDGIIDAAYAGDLQGNLWKFDLSSTIAGGWSLGNGGLPLITARNASNQVQAITSQPAVGSHPSGGVLIYFGTGRYLTSTDPADTNVQTFYAVWDKGGTAKTITRSDMQPQTIVAETNEFNYSTRETSSNTVDWAGGKYGWYMDLVSPSGTAQGERVVSAPLVKYDRVLFVTLIPSTDQCMAGGSSWIMELDASSGAHTTVSVFDLNNDGSFDANDNLASGNPSSGVKSTVAITKTPTWLTGDSKQTKDYKEFSGTSGGIMTLGNRNNNTPTPSSSGVSRVFWQQIE